MSKRKHHYVPRFYLKNFRSAPKQIHLYNIARQKAMFDVSLRDQCYRHKLYGSDDQVENNLADFEGAVAPAIKRLISEERVPSQGSQDYKLLLLFVSLQLLRTIVAADRVNESVDKLTKQVFSDDPRLKGLDLDEVSIGYEAPVLVALSNLDVMVEAIADLSIHLIVSSQGQFFTSDNPVFKYNQYCEGIRTSGVVGGSSRGLQLFVPISPKHLMALYDSKIYKFGSRNSAKDVASEKDVEQLNIMQFVSASENIYFSSTRQAGKPEDIAQKAKRYRAMEPIQVREFLAEDTDNRSLVHVFEKVPNLGLRLFFLTIRRNARRVPLHERTRPFRKELPILEPPIPPFLEGKSMRFTRSKEGRPSASSRK